MTVECIAERLVEVRSRIAAAAGRASRDPEAVEIVGVTKGFGAGVVDAALSAGIHKIGENRAQELLEKSDRLSLDSALEWHFIGRIQRNKIKRLAPLVTLWHSVDRLEVGETLARHAPRARIHVQVDMAGEEQKGGCRPEEASDLVSGLRGMGLSVEGLMTVPPFGEDPRPYFERLRELADRVGLAGLSMGMSGDFEVAVEEGATMVRLGTVLFGPRPT